MTKLARWRKAQGLTQRAAAKRAGISQAAWCIAERGEYRRLGAELAAAIERATGGTVTVADLIRMQARPHGDAA